MNDFFADLTRKDKRLIAGIMSGTSLDGVDVAMVEISGFGDSTKLKVVKFESYEYSEEMRNAIHDCLIGDCQEISTLNFRLGEEFGNCVMKTLAAAGIENESLDLIGSHGQTIYHESGLSTLQIGEPSMIAELTGTPVIADFRVRDIAAGGTGAPLVPYADFILFRGETGRLLLNLGGISNFTILPGKSDNIDAVRAWDCGPGNMLIDEAAYLISDGKLHYDKDGEYARKGNVQSEWLELLMEHPFIGNNPPKSAGREEFGTEYFKQILNELSIGTDQNKLDLIATLTRLTAEAVYMNYNEFANESESIKEVYVSGGGANNPVIMEHLSELFYPVTIKGLEDLGVGADEKEAVAFAILANEFIHLNPSNVKSVTGADKAVILGKLIP